MLRPGRTPRGRGFGFVTFKSTLSAQQAVTQRIMFLQGRQVSSPGLYPPTLLSLVLAASVSALRSLLVLSHRPRL